MKEFGEAIAVEMMAEFIGAGILVHAGFCEGYVYSIRKRVRILL